MTYLKLYHDAQIAIAVLIDKYKKDIAQNDAKYNPLFVPFDEWKAVRDSLVSKIAVLEQMLAQLDRMRKHLY